MSALPPQSPYMPPGADGNSPAPVPVVPGPPPRVGVPLLMLAPAIAALTFAVVRTSHPAVVVTRTPSVTTFVLDRAGLAGTAGLLALAALAAAAVLLMRPHARIRTLAVVALVVTVGVGWVLYHHLNARADLTRDTLVAPGRPQGVLPADPVSVRLDRLIQFDFVDDSGNRGSRFQRAYVNPKQYADLDLGPFLPAIEPELTRALEAFNVPVRRD